MQKTLHVNFYIIIPDMVLYKSSEILYVNYKVLHTDYSVKTINLKTVQI
jgi:hypothetical protein